MTHEAHSDFERNDHQLTMVRQLSPSQACLYGRFTSVNNLWV